MIINFQEGCKPDTCQPSSDSPGYIRTLVSVIYITLLSVVLAFTMPGCNRNNNVDGVKLEFSADTVMFDTVFTTITSSTRSFTVRNTTGSSVEVDIALAGDKQSYYSINVDGVPGTEFRNVEIPAHDSIFVFVKVNIDPTSQNLPYLVTDSILFYQKNRTQSVQLVACGQDAHFILPDHTGGSMSYRIIAHEHEHVHWTNDKPWVIYGWAVVDSLGKLTIDPGTKVYVHNGGGIWVYRYGNIHINGTLDEPVTITGDRLEPFFANDYTQWNALWINEGTEDNIIENAIISNASYGVHLEALEEYTGNKTIINNSVIHNTQNFGVRVEAYDLEMNNCQVSNNGSYSLALMVGNFVLNHVTVANYFTQSSRKTPAVAVTNNFEKTEAIGDEVYTVTYIGDANATFNNCIIYGTLDNEFGVGHKSEASLNYILNNCIVKRDSIQNEHFVNCTKANPKFISNYGQNYNIEETSPAVDAGMTGLGITTDILGRPRNGIPDIGAYEYYPIPEEKTSVRR